ncbi:MAG: isocitrate lyase/phosphoenolpyruvate mutase family protein [Pseudomonadota bacterium]
MPTQAEKSVQFTALHVKSDPVILYNVWDAGSAQIVDKAGAKALATGSWPVAVAHGYADGENIPFSLVVENTRRIADATDLPVSSDIEGGYGTSPQEVAASVSEIVKAGAIGFNFEDQVVGTSDFHEKTFQAERIAAAREAADALCSGVFINARTDLFLKAKPETHDGAMLDEAIERAAAYADAGASGFFAPGLADEKLIERLCASVSLPVNIIALPHVPDSKTLASLGVARISYGPVPYRKMAAWLEEQAKAAIDYK